MACKKACFVLLDGLPETIIKEQTDLPVHKHHHSAIRIVNDSDQLKLQLADVSFLKVA